ncbi:FKBP-type peptidyl-prolyl cis-trans isomerase [Myceligenerans indicum]|nr:FKBP-type peptidyl-prolyl cis-trans isomerase [Myceligenerans indicum]
MIRRLLAVLISAGVLATATACAPASLPLEIGPATTATASQAPLDVDGEPGQVPQLTYDKPFEVVRPGSRTIWPGTGDLLERDGPVLLNLYAEDGRDGGELQNTFRTSPASYTMSEASLGNHLFAALSGKRAGARVMLVEADTADGGPAGGEPGTGEPAEGGDAQDGAGGEEPGESGSAEQEPGESGPAGAEPDESESESESEGESVPVVLVVDVLPTRASGTELPDPPAELPQVSRDELGAPTVRIPRGAKPPGTLEVVPLVRGRGPQVAKGEVITVELQAVAWGDGGLREGEVVESTWEDGVPPRSAQVGIGALIEGWDAGLVQQPVGSQVMLVVPPGMAYAGTKSPLAGETLVYVIDILDAHKPVQDNEKKKD